MASVHMPQEPGKCLGCNARKAEDNQPCEDCRPVVELMEKYGRDFYNRVTKAKRFLDRRDNP